MKNFGQTGRPFRVRFHEHLRNFKYGNRKSKFATHLLDNRHSIDKMESVMETFHITNKGRMKDTLKRFYIFWETKLNNQINDRMTVKSNTVFETIVQRDPYREYSPPAYSSNQRSAQSCKFSIIVHTERILQRKHHLRSTTSYVNVIHGHCNTTP